MWTAPDMANARLLLPDSMAAGDVVKARLLVEHPMHTGYLQDLQGRLIPRNVICLLYTSPSPRDRQKSRMPSSA